MKYGNDGITCDKCGSTHRSDFVYYSLDFFSFVNIGKQPDPRSVMSGQAAHSVDYCELCYGQLVSDIVHNFTKTRKIKLPMCELSMEILPRGTASYYCVVTKATVRSNNSPFVCKDCGIQITDTKKPCKCSSTTFVKKASVITDQRLIEFLVSAKTFGSLTAKENNQWTTKT